jgi:hypothetical protein
MVMSNGGVWYTLRSDFRLASYTEERGSIPRRCMTSAVAPLSKDKRKKNPPSVRITDHRLTFNADARGYERRWCLVHPPK